MAAGEAAATVGEEDCKKLNEDGVGAAVGVVGTVRGGAERKLNALLLLVLLVVVFV